MGVVINTNISSISAARALDSTRSDLERAMERLSSGKRINSASDDATGMAVAAKMRGDIRSLDQAVRNANDGISLVNTYDGAAAEVEQILVRIRELAIQSSSDTYASADRTQADQEFDALIAEINRIDDNTKFNTQVVAGATFTFQIGATTADTLAFQSNSIDATTLTVASGLDTAANATATLGQVDIALGKLATARAEAGS